MKVKLHPDKDEDLKLAKRALIRAAARARQLAEETGTPLYVIKDGIIVNLNAGSAHAYLLREDSNKSR